MKQIHWICCPNCGSKTRDRLRADTILINHYKAALTPKQEESLLAFMEQDTVYRKYRDEVIILLGTGLRISEFCGLTTALDFKNRQINVDHQLLRDADIGYYIETPKTKNGIRQIPMSREVYQALKRVLKNRGNAAPFSVEGYKNFLFLKNDGMPKVSANYTTFGFKNMPRSTKI